MNSRRPISVTGIVLGVQQAANETSGDLEDALEAFDAVYQASDVGNAAQMDRRAITRRRDSAQVERGNETARCRNQGTASSL